MPMAVTAMFHKPRKFKYRGNQPTVVDGIRFDSKKEANKVGRS